ncbi:hypothetical protein [Pseudonocardia sp.]|uniref:hypothetical protein n=1 Tax=Pseudonocardia sp. TaxID=60912 RepID=UPI003D12643E
MTSTSHPVSRTVGTPIDGAASPAGAKALAVLRLAIGFTFLWAFLDKTFAFGYATTAERAWLNGGSPTRGFLNSVEIGPFEAWFHSIAGAWWADTLFMLGLLGVGVAVMLGVGLRVSAVAGTLMMALMWLAEFPLATLTNAGEPSGSTNPLVDYHVIYALVLIAVAATAAGNTWGLGKAWQRLPFVDRHRWLV